MPSETDSLLQNSNAAATIVGSKIPISLRWTTNLLSLTATFFFSGIIFGWAPLQLILFKEGTYASLCDSQLVSINVKSGVPLCSEQTNALAGMFTVGQFFLNFCSFFVGMALDYLPKSILLAITAIVEITGMLLLAISDTNTADRDYFHLAYSLLAIGGSATMLSAFPASFLLKQYQAGLLASISCLFDASSIIFSIAKTLQEHFGWGRQEMLYAYTIWAVLLYTPLTMCWIILERKDWQKVLEDEDRDEELEMETSKKSHDIEGDAEGQSSLTATSHLLAHVKHIKSMDLADQLRTTDFAFTMFFVATHMIQCNYTICIYDSFLLTLGDMDSKYATIFSWALPSGFFFVPFIERTITYLGIVHTLHTTNALGLIFGFLLLVPVLNVQMFNFFVLTGFRAFFYSTINMLVATTFGVQTMGRIIGIVFTTASVIGLAQYPMEIASEAYFEGDYFPMNTLLLVVAILPTMVTFQYDRYVTAGSEDSMPVHQRRRRQSSGRSQMSPALILTPPGRELTNSIRQTRLLHNEGDV